MGKYGRFDFLPLNVNVWPKTGQSRWWHTLWLSLVFSDFNVRTFLRKLSVHPVERSPLTNSMDTQTHTDRHRQKKGQQTVLLKIHFQPFWTLLVDCSHVISQMVRFGSFSCGPHIGHVMINILFILESTVYDCLYHKMTVFGPKKAKCGRNITIPKWPKW